MAELRDALLALVDSNLATGDSLRTSGRSSALAAAPVGPLRPPADSIEEITAVSPLDRIPHAPHAPVASVPGPALPATPIATPEPALLPVLERDSPPRRWL